MSEDKVLGKRKQRDDGDEPVPGSTIFVSNLPYTATSTDLQTLFSDLAPVRSAFVVLSENVSKGVGYVSFAIKEDAKTAMETIEKEGLKLNGRALRVQWADRKLQGNGENKMPKGEKPSGLPSKIKLPIAKVDKDPDAIRTVIVSGLANTVDKKTLWKKIRKLNGAESVDMTENGDALAIFSTPANASYAVEKLHAHIFKGFILSATLKKRVEGLAKVSNGTAAPNRGSRLIVRNVPWNITEQDLRALFLPYGPIYSIAIPNASSDPEESAKKQRSRGFVFIWFYSKKDAEKAIAGVNGREVVAGAVSAPTMNKKERARQRKKARQELATSAGNESDDDDPAASGDEENGLKDVPKVKGRVLAVDWALSKEKWEKAKEEQMDEANSGIDGDSVSGSSSAEESDSGSDLSTADSDASDEDGAVEIDEHTDAEETGRPILPQTDVGTTVFVRNVPFEATEDELRVLFRAFGPLRYARITVDSETGRSRGTGFACFWNKEDADTAIQQAELLNRETLASSSSGSGSMSKNPFSLPSLLTPDPSSSLAQSLVLHGRTLSVTRAVTREDASRLKDEGERAREKADKRNLYLLREGVIFPNSPAASSISASELEKRNASFSARRNLLKSNPSLFVSKTRLSVRQLPLFVSDRALKRLGVHAVRAFEEEAKGGSRQPISADELFADREPAADNEEDAAKTKAKKRKGERETGVKQAKVVRQADRIDPATGKGRSRGYGFLEMKRHSDALRVLRWANNNRELFNLFEEWWSAELRDMINGLEKVGKEEGKKADEDVEARLKRLRHELERLEKDGGKKEGKTLVVEFSIENTQVVKRRKEKDEAARTTQRELRKHEEDGVDTSERRSQKKLKVNTGAPVAVGKPAPVRNDAGTHSEDTEPTRPANPLGSIIGRKRKMRKAKGRA